MNQLARYTALALALKGEVICTNHQVRNTLITKGLASAVGDNTLRVTRGGREWAAMRSQSRQS